MEIFFLISSQQKLKILFANDLDKNAKCCLPCQFSSTNSILFLTTNLSRSAFLFFQLTKNHHKFQQQRQYSAIHSKKKTFNWKEFHNRSFYFLRFMEHRRSFFLPLFRCFYVWFGCLQKNVNPPLWETKIFDRCWKHKHTKAGMKCCWFSSFTRWIFHFIRHKVSLLHFLMTHFLGFSCRWEHCGRDKKQIFYASPIFTNENSTVFIFQQICKQEMMNCRSFAFVKK